MRRFINNLYIHIKYRVNSKRRAAYYGLSICTKEEFIDFSMNNEDLKRLYASWEKTPTRSLLPTIDRIDSTRGYSLDNIRWITLSENSRRARFYLRRKKNKLPTGVSHGRRKGSPSYDAGIRDNYKHVYIGRFDTPEEAHKAYIEYKLKINPLSEK